MRVEPLHCWNPLSIEASSDASVKNERPSCRRLVGLMLFCSSALAYFNSRELFVEARCSHRR
jgi:hypothetical protein